MPMVVMRNDITKIEADAIVNPANRRLEHGNGTSDAIFQKAGAEKLAKACQAIGSCQPGCAVATEGFDLPCKYIIHTVGPLYVDGGRGEEALLRNAYLSALKLAQAKGCQSIAFPLLSSGNMKYPKAEAMRVALTVISEYIIQHDLLVYLVVYDNDSFELSKKICAEVRNHIDEAYIAQNPEKHIDEKEYKLHEALWSWQYESEAEADSSENEYWERALAGRLAAPREDFQQMLLRLIDAKGVKTPEAYDGAGIDRREFSHVINYEQKPDRQFVAKFILYFGMGLDEAEYFMAKAGFGMSDADDFDIILRVLIENSIFEIDTFQDALAQRGIKLKVKYRERKEKRKKADKRKGSQKQADS